MIVEEGHGTHQCVCTLTRVSLLAPGSSAVGLVENVIFIAWL